MMRTTWMTACVATSVLVAPALGQVSEDAKALIAESAQAIQNTKGVTFHVQKSATSMLKDIVDLSGDVKIYRATPGGPATWMVDGRAKQPGKPDKKITMVTDGKTVKWLDYEQNTYFERPAGDQAAMEPEKLVEQMLGMDWTGPKPFARELQMDTMNKTGADKVGDTVCDMVELTSKNAPGRTTTIAFGAADKLPRRYELASGTGKDKIAMITEMTNLKVVNLTPKDMEIAVPAGFPKNVQAAGSQPAGDQGTTPPAPKVDVGLKPGTPAPAFTAEDTSGKPVTLDGVKGKPTVLEFWGPMFKQSTKNADAMKAFASDAGKNGVQVVSFACRDSSGQAGKMWQTSGAGYPLVPKGDEVADQFKVAGFPTYVVLDKNGNVAAYFQDFPGTDKLMQATASADK